MADILDRYGNPIGWSIDKGNGRTDFYDLDGHFTGYSILRGDAGYADQYDANGYIIGTSYTDANGNVTYYDNQGREMRRQDAEPDPNASPGTPDSTEKLSTMAAIRSLLIPSPDFDFPIRKDTEDTGAAVARYVMAALLPAVTLLLAKTFLPYTILLAVDTILAFYISRSLLKQKLLTGMIFVNTIYTMVVSCIYAQFLWQFPIRDAEPLQYIVVGAFFLIGLIFVGSIESKGYFSYSGTKPLEVLFFLALTAAWGICTLLGTTTEKMRSVLNVILIIQGIYSLFVIMNRLVELVNLVRSKSGISESTGGQMVRYVLYVLLFLGIRKMDPGAMPVIYVLLAASAAAFLLTRMNVLNRFRTVSVLINALYSLILLASYTNYLIHLYEWRPAAELLLFLFMLFTVLFLLHNLEQGSYASFRFTKPVMTLLLLAQAVLYATYRLHIAQDFTWIEIRQLMQYILLGGAVFALMVLIVQLIAGGKKQKAPVQEG
ncbi:MAG: hypothetical protein K5695_12400 [Oscillospiraceae bacterium]|nr:hypothetical protein [Oscillospiraceae bacterium]